MKKLERLTLKELGNSVEVLDQRESMGLKGGDGDAEYLAKYGVQLPSGMGYDPTNDVCYSLGNNSQNQTSYPGTDQWQSTMNVPSGSNSNPCHACGSFDNATNNQPSMDGDGGFWNSMGEYLFKTLPHELGILGHQ